VAAEFAAQLLVTPRASGQLTIGDTHVDDRPGAYALEERAYEYLTRRFASVFGEPHGAIRRRWLGRYARLTDDTRPYLCETPEGEMVVLTAVGGLGLTAGPAIAVEVCDALEL
jgi:hypothetical protein